MKPTTSPCRRRLARRACTLLLLGLPGLERAAAQPARQVERQDQVWAGYFNQARFSSHWGLWSDLHLRTRDHFVDRFSVSVLRLGLLYYLKEDTKLAAGAAWLAYYPAPGHTRVTQPEHRYWQLLQWKNRYTRLQLTQGIRLEERFRRRILNDSTLGNGYTFNYRLRYNLLLLVPFNGQPVRKGTWSAVLNSEWMMNFGQQIVRNYFDQIRLFGGLDYQVGRLNHVQAGYMHIFQQLSGYNQFRVIHAARLFLFHYLDARRAATGSHAGT
ncbi:MAG TPA: DUF2490 domain-containing protein [Chitinophagaceae bacterium]|nr:DUF2490 domain-containing protein [Chitinophagaceae bacterium]